MKGLTRADYKDALNFILDNVEYTYNIKEAFKIFINSMEEDGLLKDIFKTSEGEELLIEYNDIIVRDDISIILYDINLFLFLL